MTLSFAGRIARRAPIVALLVGAACSDTTTSVAPGFLGGTPSDHEVGVVVNSTGKSLTLFQLGSPATTEQIALGTSSTITPVGLSVRNRLAAVPLGDAASVALVDLQAASIKRFFTFASGNATGSAWVDDTTIVAANLFTNQVGRMTTTQASDAITSTAIVAAQPGVIVVSGGSVFVVSANLDSNFVPIDSGIVTKIDPKTMQVVGTVKTGGSNSTDAAIGPDGNLYVVNTRDYVAQANLTIINPATMQVVTTVNNIGVGADAITFDAAGLAYLSSFSFGTAVWNSGSRQFVRDPSNPLCAKVAGGSCRTASVAAVSASGKIYQAFFGSQSLAPYLFVYAPTTFALTDSVAVGSGPTALVIRTF